MCSSKVTLTLARSGPRFWLHPSLKWVSRPVPGFLFELILDRFEKERKQFDYYYQHPEEVHLALAKGAEKAPEGQVPVTEEAEAESESE